MAKSRMTLELTEGLNEKLERMAGESGVSKADVIRKALALFDVAHDANQKGKKLGVFSKDDKIEKEIVGI